ncbi:hypothetical protein PoMZ_01544 [Pyricularia oryzae]|uniref:Uncharacterized protein n=1 Tax=Pyricularia oryzae TaxID=318829 RepID=A0A4P7N920_PYROR|nr:hypothetical protein PoMZ_01544 [Pyricularia oryzae]
MFTMRGSFDFMALTGSDEKPWADASEGRGRLTAQAKRRRSNSLHDMG